MNKRKIIVLSAVIAALLLVLLAVLLMDSPEKQEGVSDSSAELHGAGAEKSYEETGDIYRCDMDSITKISVTLPGSSFTFEKTDLGWQCPQMANVPLNSSKVGQVATRLSSVKYVEAFDEEVTATDCGIDEASPSITFECNLGSVTLTASDSFNDENLSYMAASVSDVVYSVKRDITEILFRPLSDYRNDSLKNIDFESATDIVLVNGVADVILKKGEVDTSKAIYNAWRMLSPLEAAANDSAITESIIGAMENLKITGYADDNGNFASYGLAVKNKYLKVTNESGRTQTLYFSDKINGQHYVCVDEGINIYSVDASLMPFASLSAIDLADRHVKLVMKDSLSSIRVEASDAEYEINVSAEKNESSVNGNKLDETEFSRKVFTAVCGLIADDIYTENAGEPTVTVTYTYTDSIGDVIEFAPYNDRYCTVSENGSARFLIQKGKLDEMLNSLSKYK